MSANVTEEWLKTSDSHEIYTKTWKPTTSNPIATLVLVHGFGEHVGRYDRLLSYFASQGIECYGFDQRGFGQTCKKSGQFGNNQGYDTALKDIDNAVIKTKHQDLPLFLMGHSMGGGLILNYLARGNIYKGVELVTGAIASAPLVTLSMPVPAVKYYGLRVMANVLPSITISANIDQKGMTHDPEETRIYQADPLIHDYATLATFKSFLDAGTDVITTQAKLIKTPILYSHADADPINSYEGTAEAYELTASEDKELKNWAGLYHELHNETLPERQQISDYYVDWIKTRCTNIKN